VNDNFVFVDNSEAFKKKLNSAFLAALERCGMQGEGYSKDLVPVDTGNLRNSISHKVDSSEPSVYIGTNSEYGAYVELGTGEHYPGGRQTPWVYKDAHGNWHRTSGQKAQPFLKPAVANHRQTYRNIIEDELKNG
jgi:HK97 gp10 family phage protein